MAHVPEERNTESSLRISATVSISNLSCLTKKITHHQLQNYTNHNTKSNLIFYLKTTLQLCLFKRINSVQVLSGRIASTYWLHLLLESIFLFLCCNRLDHKTKIVLLNTISEECASCMKYSIC